VVRTGEGDPGVPVRGLVSCGSSESGELELEPARPLVVFVPGWGDDGTRFREMALRFELQGQQVACYDYDQRQSLEESSGRLARDLEELETRLQPSRIVVLGHSMGGLVARRALVQDRKDALRSGEGFTYRLITVASPFGGIRSSADCGRNWLHALTFGASALVCSLVAGNTWQELPPGSAFVTHPGTLLPEVEEAIQVVTDERHACRRRAVDGSCLTPDSVFTLGEQRNPTIERDPRVHRLQVTAGHVEIVGEVGIPPAKLIAILEGQGVLIPARVARP
jgi:pimeloyl-ACP methyl ester carboxylesterase